MRVSGEIKINEWLKCKSRNIFLQSRAATSAKLYGDFLEKWRKKIAPLLRFLRWERRVFSKTRYGLYGFRRKSFKIATNIHLLLRKRERENSSCKNQITKNRVTRNWLYQQVYMYGWSGEQIPMYYRWKGKVCMLLYRQDASDKAKFKDPRAKLNVHEEYQSETFRVAAIVCTESISALMHILRY